jgi:cytochrome P450
MTIPIYSHDLYTDDALLDPFDHYRKLRDLGPVVWLEAHDMYVLSRFAEVRAALTDPATFCSSHGVGMNDQINNLGGTSTLVSDGALHTKLRGFVGRGLTPKALRPLRDEVQAQADTLVERLVEDGSFDAVADLAQVLPLSVVPDLIGWPAGEREHLLEWGSASFDFFGPMNARTQGAGPCFAAMVEFAERMAAEGNFLSGSVGADLLDAAQKGELEPERLPSLILDTLAPSLDTTVSAIGSAMWLFGTHPDQWDLLRSDPGLIPKAFNETLRLETPLQGFSRVVTADTPVGATVLPAGSRVLMSFASANRDERRWGDPERFDIMRDSAAQLAFGFGDHLCVGAGLARLEAHAVLHALVQRVERFELGEAIRSVNNVIRSFKELPVKIRPS